MPAGSYVLLAKAGVNSGASARVVCRLFADSVELDKSILTSGSVAGYLSQGEITLMSAATLTATSTVTVSCRIEGGFSAAAGRPGGRS